MFKVCLSSGLFIFASKVTAANSREELFLILNDIQASITQDISQNIEELEDREGLKQITPAEEFEATTNG